MSTHLVDATSSDTLSAVGVTGSVVYVSRSERSMNNSFERDNYTGPHGAIYKPGIAAPWTR